MRTSSAIAFATLYGLTIRIMFGFIGDIINIMSVSFLVIGPVVIGFLTIILLPKKKILSGSAAFFTPWLTSLAILIITIFFNIEGSICWVMIYPLFATLAGIGGLYANTLRRKKIEVIDKENHDYWTKPDKMATGLIMLFPMLMGILEGERTLTRKDIDISREIVILAKPEAVWNALGNAKTTVKPGNMFSLSSMLGFPRHQQTILDTLCLGGRRRAIYEKGLYFNEIITNYQPFKMMVLNIKTDPFKIPKNVMDEHILIGGKYLDILQDTYKLDTLPGGRCRLTLSSHFYINTPFNWYAGMWANYLMSDILNDELDMVQARVNK